MPKPPFPPLPPDTQVGKSQMAPGGTQGQAFRRATAHEKTQQRTGAEGGGMSAANDKQHCSRRENEYLRAAAITTWMRRRTKSLTRTTNGARNCRHFERARAGPRSQHTTIELCA